MRILRLLDDQKQILMIVMVWVMINGLGISYIEDAKMGTGSCFTSLRLVGALQTFLLDSPPAWIEIQERLCRVIKKKSCQNTADNPKRMGTQQSMAE